MIFNWRESAQHRTLADSTGSEQKYSHKPRPSTRVTLNTDQSEDEWSDYTNESQHLELDKTEKIYQRNIPEDESETNDISEESRHLVQSTSEDIQHDKRHKTTRHAAGEKQLV